MDIYRQIEQRIMEGSDLVKAVHVEEIDGQMMAMVYPDFERLKARQIINVRDEVKWYVIETYNLNMVDNIRVDSFRVVNEILSTKDEHEIDETVETSTIYQQLKTYLTNVTTSPITPLSHLELDLELDSLEYVMLFVYVEKSFGLHLDEAIFSNLMLMKDLVKWIEEQHQQCVEVEVAWHDVLKHKSKEVLVRSPWVMMVWRAFCWPYFKLFHTMEAIGVERLPKGNFIIAPTHHSALDGFAIIAALPASVLRETFFLAYEGEFGKPHLRPLAKHSQMLLIDINKDLIASLQRTALPLIEGKNLVIFPENARSRDGKLLPFKKFFAVLSTELNLPIVPVILKGTFEAMPTGATLPKRVPIVVEFLEPVYPEDMDDETLNIKVQEYVKAHR